MNALHLVLSLTLTMKGEPQDIIELADSFQVIICCFRVTGIKPGFFHALPKGNAYPRHLYFLFNSNHFNYKSKNVGCAEDFQTFTICMFLCTVQQGVFCKLRRTYVLKRRRWRWYGCDTLHTQRLYLPFFQMRAKKNILKCIASPTAKERRHQSQDYSPWLWDLSRRSTPCDTYTYRTDTSLFTKYFQSHWIILIRMNHIFSWSMNLILNLSMRKRWIIMSVSIRNVWLLFLIVTVVMSVQCTLC